LESISSYKLSRQNATLLTFLVSSLFHEVVMVVSGKRIRMYLFILQMLQIPLIYVARIPAVKRQKTFGNVFFWFGMCLGPPLLAVLYAREHFMEVVPTAMASP
jgi:sterol O-acyltransferase